MNERGLVLERDLNYGIRILNHLNQISDPKIRQTLFDFAIGLIRNGIRWTNSGYAGAGTPAYENGRAMDCRARDRREVVVRRAPVGRR